MSELLTDKKVEDIDNFSSIKPVTAANLSNTLKIYRNLFITWYEMYGFHFADIEKYLTHGMIFRFSSAIKQSVKNFLDRKYGLMNYAIEYCPVCKKREVVYTTGQTKCSNCSTLITPCDACLNCTDICPYKSGEIHNSPSILERQIIHFI